MEKEQEGLRKELNEQEWTELREEIARFRYLLAFTNTLRAAQASEEMRPKAKLSHPLSPENTRSPETIEELRMCLSFANTLRANS